MTTKNNQLLTPICAIKFADISDIQSINPGNDRHHRTVVFYPGKAWIDLYFAPGSANFIEDQLSHAAGPIFDQQLSLTFPGEDISNRNEFFDVGNKRRIYIIVYGSGYTKLFGSKENPVITTVKTDSGINGSRLNLTRKGDKCYWLQ